MLEFTAPSVGDWFNVQWAEDGYATGSAWNTTAAETASGGSWTRPAGDGSTFDGTRLSLVAPEEGLNVLRFTPSKEVKNASDFTVRGETVVSTGPASAPPAGALGALLFLESGPAVWTGESWTTLAGDVPETGDTVAWKLEIKLAGEGAPAIRYTLDGAVRSTAEERPQTWIPLPAGTTTLQGVGFAGGGKIGDFRGYYTAVVVGTFEKPEFGTSAAGGDALGFGVDPATGAATFTVSIDNASAAARYAVYVCETVDGDYVLDQVRAGVDGDMAFSLDGESPTRFVKIVAAEPGYEFPQHFDDIEGIEE